MKFLTIICTAISNLWEFITKTFTICLIATIILLGMAISMPDNAEKVFEIVKNIF